MTNKNKVKNLSGLKNFSTEMLFSNPLLICGLVFCFTLEVTSHPLDDDCMTENSPPSVNHHKHRCNLADIESNSFNHRRPRDITEDTNNMVAGAFSVVSNAVESVSIDGKIFLNDVIDNIKDKFVAVKSISSDTTSKVGGSIKDTADYMFNSGKTVFKTLADSIKDIYNTVLKSGAPSTPSFYRT